MSAVARAASAGGRSATCATARGQGLAYHSSFQVAPHAAALLLRWPSPPSRGRLRLHRAAVRAAGGQAVGRLRRFAAGAAHVRGPPRGPLQPPGLPHLRRRLLRQVILNTKPSEHKQPARCHGPAAWQQHAVSHAHQVVKQVVSRQTEHREQCDISGPVCIVQRLMRPHPLATPSSNIWTANMDGADPRNPAGRLVLSRVCADRSCHAGCHATRQPASLPMRLAGRAPCCLRHGLGAQKVRAHDGSRLEENCWPGSPGGVLCGRAGEPPSTTPPRWL